MNYRHSYHAGNICDVVKHAVLLLLLERLRDKDTSFAVLDTHAGAGLYDLTDSAAQKTGEAAAGIEQLRAAEPIAELARYDAIRLAVNHGDKTGQLYPGSPLLVQQMLRPQDRLIACELHPDDCGKLRRVLAQANNVQIHQRDGYEALRALLPPPEKRGLVFIDPPFEKPNEFTQLITAMQTVARRWPQGQMAIWYPIKERPAIWRFHEQLVALGLPKILLAEFIYQDEVRADRLNGCGFILLNPPWQFDLRLSELFPKLHAALQTPHQAVTITWLSPA
jgi:23S rRNA (adenine2030-N6)-methyltransferase